MSGEDTRNTGLDIEDFLEFYLLDSHEQIDKLDTGLLQLERDGENIALVNELFRCAHSLKGSSGTMGFTPIVQLTHMAEDLLDKLRQGKMKVTNEIIDVLLAVADKLKLMLNQVEQREDITTDYEDLLDRMQALMETGAVAEGALSPTVDKAAGAESAEPPEETIEFPLEAEELEEINRALLQNQNIYKIRVDFTPNTMMKAVRAILVSQRLEQLGTVFKLVPSVEELETDPTEYFHVLLATAEAPQDIRADVLEISEIAEVMVSHYSLSEQLEQQRVKTISPPVQEDKKPLTTAQPTQQEAAKPQDNGTNQQVHTIRVDTARMDNLINLAGELVITRTRLVKIAEDLKAQNPSDPLVNSLNETNVYFGRLMSDLQESVMRLRMVPIGTVFSRYPRLVRDFCRKTGKKIDLVINGEETELDKTVIELIGDPLTHIIRNSVDHGIEAPEDRIALGKPEVGTITLDAYHEGNHISIVISDDGAGLDLAKVYNKALAKGLISENEEMSERDIANLIFLPGFSTADEVTDISGRGVGMDVVRKTLNDLGGVVDIRTKQGEGTSFIIRLPLTLAIIQALLVEVRDEVYAIPLSSVVETLLIKQTEIKTVGRLPMVQVRGNTLPLISLREKFEIPEDQDQKEEVYVVVVGLGERTIGLIVDELQGQQEIVIKS
ncbi:MAG: chemotaxis protein CheA, partial [Peptococcaceae bacterium]|nr:chemotaxis protein CheA [Peptococcaceae bacterium]